MLTVLKEYTQLIQEKESKISYSISIVDYVVSDTLLLITQEYFIDKH